MKVKTDFFREKTIGIVGFGQTGRSVFEALHDSAASLYIFDDKVLHHPCYVSGDDFDFENLDLMVVSPGIHIWWDIHPIVDRAKRFSVPIINDIDIFQRHLDFISTSRNCQRPKVIGITGTNGKSTTTALTYHIIKKGGRTEIGGNFGTPVLSLSDESENYVLELSSYQLESCNILGFDTAVLLNITPDHLARHGGINGYIAAKQRIFSGLNNNSTAIISMDDENCRHLLDHVALPRIIKISGKELPSNGVGWENDALVDNRDGRHEVICGKYEKLEGEHNRQNIAAAYVACVANGIDKECFVDGLFSFGGLKHRQEFVRRIDGVQYINDSKATNADSVEQALKRYEKIILILGGLPKEGGIVSLVPYFCKIKYALLIGKVADDWHELLNKHNVPNEVVHTLESAVRKAHEIAHDGDTVLLSPACASFDQFKSFEERGDQFKLLVGNLER